MKRTSKLFVFFMFLFISHRTVTTGQQSTGKPMQKETKKVLQGLTPPKPQEIAKKTTSFLDKYPALKRVTSLFARPAIELGSFGHIASALKKIRAEGAFENAAMLHVISSYFNCRAHSLSKALEKEPNIEPVIHALNSGLRDITDLIDIRTTKGHDAALKVFKTKREDLEKALASITKNLNAISSADLKNNVTAIKNEISYLLESILIELALEPLQIILASIVDELHTLKYIIIQQNAPFQVARVPENLLSFWYQSTVNKVTSYIPFSSNSKEQINAVLLQLDNVIKNIDQQKQTITFIQDQQIFHLGERVKNVFKPILSLLEVSTKALTAYSKLVSEQSTYLMVETKTSQDLITMSEMVNNSLFPKKIQNLLFTIISLLPLQQTEK
jgi:hypothetical protein